MESKGQDLGVSVVIPTYNAAAFIGHAVESVLGQTETPLEVIVVDDGSTDGTAEVLTRYGATIRVATHSANRGLPAARNTGIRIASGDLIGLLDADDVWAPSMIEKQRQEFERAPAIGLCFTRLVDCNVDLEPIAKPRRYRGRCSERVFDELYMNAFPIPPSTVFLRRLAIERIGYFDETMLKKQDFECWLRLAMLYPVSCIPEVLCRRRVHEASLTTTGRGEAAMAFEARAFDLCGLAATRMNIELPLPVAERKVLSFRRRMREYLRYGDIATASIYRSALVESRELSSRDQFTFQVRGLEARVRSIFRTCYRLSVGD